MTLLEFYLQQTGKKANDLTIDELNILGIAIEFFKEFNKQ
jgi:hypothetical protein